MILQVILASSYYLYSFAFKLSTCLKTFQFPAIQFDQSIQMGDWFILRNIWLSLCKSCIQHVLKSLFHLDMFHCRENIRKMSKGEVNFCCSTSMWLRS